MVHADRSVEPATLSPVDVAARLRDGLARRGLDTELVEACQGWWVCAGRRAYKLLKARPDEPADTATRLARRHAALAEELRLNAALAPALYLRVLAVHAGPRGLLPGGPGPVVDAAMQVRRLGPQDLASGWLARGALTGATLADVACRLARFHQDAAHAAPSGPDPLAERAAAALQALDELPADARLKVWLSERTQALATRRAQRLAQGHVRTVHGDLHLGHLAHDGEAFVPIGRLPGEQAQGGADTMLDVAGLVMDLWAHGRRDLGFGFLDAYLRASGDHDGLDLLTWLLVLRAVERARGEAWRAAFGSRGTGLHPADYLGLAERLTAPPAPRLLLLYGGTSAARARIGHQLIERGGALCVHGPAEDGDELAERVVACLRAGYPSIVDVPPAGRALRDRLRMLAAAQGAPWAVLAASPPGPGLEADEQACAIAWPTDRPASTASLLAAWLGQPSGTSTSIRVPAPDSPSTRSVPPAARTRSRMPSKP